MQIRYVISALFLAVSLPLGGFAYGGKDKDEKIDKVLEELNLDDGREEEVRQIMEDFYDQKKQIRERAHNDVKELKDRKKERLEAVLTESEMDQLEEMRKEKKDKHGDKHRKKH